MSEAPGRRRVFVVLAASVATWVAFAVPVLRSQDTRDPLDHGYTDHLRSRYCAALVLESPLRALRVPLREVAATDTREHRAVLWEENPCHQPGLVFLAVHAPLQWLLDAEVLGEVAATHVAVLVSLTLAHVAVALLLCSRRWWAGVLLYPFLMRCALNALQEPLPALLALLGAMSWVGGRRVRALVFVTLAFSAYNRWGVWLPAFAWLCWRDRAELLRELESPMARVALACAGVVAAWSVAGSLLVASAWTLPPSKLGVREYLPLLLAVVAWALVLWRTRDSQLAPVMLCALAFLVAYRSLLPYWYLTMALMGVPLVRRRYEAVLWIAVLLVLPDAVFHQGFWPSAATRLLINGWT